MFEVSFAPPGAAVPADIELGFHLCYGDLDVEHFVQPSDATKMVEITWMHMPMPIDRTDDAFYQPLSTPRSTRCG